MRFVAVYFRWWMESGCFKTEELEGVEDLDTAEQLVDAKCHREGATFKHVDGFVLQIGDEETIGRKLTWRERLTGTLSPRRRDEEY